MTENRKKWWDGDKELRSAGELISGGGISGAFMTLLYVVIGIGFWSLVGCGLDLLFHTHWIVWVGAGLGALGGFYLVFHHMQHRKTP